MGMTSQSDRLEQRKAGNLTCRLCGEPADTGRALIIHTQDAHNDKGDELVSA